MKAGQQFIARLYDSDTVERDVTLYREGGFPFLPGQYVEVEFAVEGEGRTDHLHGHVIESDDEKVVIRGHFASDPKKVWAVT